MIPLCRQKGVETARKRVVLSSLYLGTGKQEQELVCSAHTRLSLSLSHTHKHAHARSTLPILQVNTIHHAISDGTRPHLHCSILLDCLRGMRGHPNSVSMLHPLLSDHHAHQLSLHLYHTPNLRGVVKRVFPERFNEGMGLQHMKIYIFDDSLLLSGSVGMVWGGGGDE